MNARRDRILLCDDEPHLREMVAEYLCERGFDVAEAPDAASLHDQMARAPADLVVLDITMPGEDGLTALQRLRLASEVPVIMLTAAAEVADRVVGLELGADDYLGKPIDLRELEARIKAALRRRPVPAERQRARQGGQVEFGRCRLDLDRGMLFDPDHREIPITAMEFSILRVFAENRGRVLSRDLLAELAHDRTWDPFDRSLDLRISRLRRKIEANPKKPEIIRTVRGTGYIFG